MYVPYKMYVPLKSSTHVSNDGYEWRPQTFFDFLQEVDHLKNSIPSICYFRGQRRSDRLLDSTFARNMKRKRRLEETKRYSPSLRSNVKFQHQLAKNLLESLKSVPVLSSCFSRAKSVLQIYSHPVDLLFEYHIHVQQNPGDSNLQEHISLGTNFIDFSLNSDIGLFFANRNRQATDEGALFIVRRTALGKAEHVGDTPYTDILRDLDSITEENNLRKYRNQPLQEYSRLPLIPWPKAQLNNSLDSKPKRQEAAYIAQMDLRYDLELCWKQLYQETGKQVFVKVILPPHTTEEVQNYLTEKGLTNEFLFPKTTFDKI